MTRRTIDLPPDLEQRLVDEAARRGQRVDDLVRRLLEQGMQVPGPPDEAADFWCGLQRGSPEDLLRMAEAQNVGPLNPRELAGGWPAGEDVEEFLEARRRWQWEGRTPARSDPE